MIGRLDAVIESVVFSIVFYFSKYRNFNIKSFVRIVGLGIIIGLLVIRDNAIDRLDFEELIFIYLGGIFAIDELINNILIKVRYNKLRDDKYNDDVYNDRLG